MRSLIVITLKIIKNDKYGTVTELQEPTKKKYWAQFPKIKINNKFTTFQKKKSKKFIK